MSKLDISGTKQRQRSDNGTSMGIGARIMRQLRRSTSNTEKSNNDLKKKNLNSKAIEKLYLNKSVGRLKHTQLETIFEHEDESNPSDNFIIDSSKLFGKRKIKRTVSCTDGASASKTLKQKRKRRSQKIFGVHKKLKKISMQKFLERLKGSDKVELPPEPLVLDEIVGA